MTFIVHIFTPRRKQQIRDGRQPPRSTVMVSSLGTKIARKISYTHVILSPGIKSSTIGESRKFDGTPTPEPMTVKARIASRAPPTATSVRQCNLADHQLEVTEPALFGVHAADLLSDEGPCKGLRDTLEEACDGRFMGQLFDWEGLLARPQAAHWYDVDFWGPCVSLPL
jgi:hypothetical protein